MLSKLCKYELKATARIFLPLFLSLVVFALISKLISAFNPQWPIPAAISHAIYIMIMAGMFVMTLTVMIQRFYKNLLCDEGYLMFTLPTSSWMHIVSKLLISMLWIIASVFVAIFTALIITFRIGALNGVMQVFSMVLSRLMEYWSVSASLTILLMIIAILMSLSSGILLIYASIATGHLFNKHKILASFGAFIVLNTLSRIMVTIIAVIGSALPFANLHITLNNLASSLPVVQIALAFGIVFVGLQSAAYFAITNYILSKRLNLE